MNETFDSAAEKFSLGNHPGDHFSGASHQSRTKILSVFQGFLDRSISI